MLKGESRWITSPKIRGCREWTLEGCGDQLVRIAGIAHHERVGDQRAVRISRGDVRQFRAPRLSHVVGYHNVLPDSRRTASADQHEQSIAAADDDRLAAIHIRDLR